MAGRILGLCFDGTSNRYGTVNTNVVKLYAMLDRAGNDQLAYYQPGIGTIAPPGMFEKAKKWLVTKLDLAIAWLLEDHVSAGYRFLMRYYQDGDRIFIFGFSRGAYTARAVAGMLYKVGLLTQGNEELLPFAWDIFCRPRNTEVSEGFRHTFSRKVQVDFLGLWDTVSSVGWAWNPQSLPFTANNPCVLAVRHAVALDERRAYFVQNLWGRDPDLRPDLDELWFPGSHGDVGGGYPEKEAGLSKVALEWMVGEAEKAGLRFDPRSKQVILPGKDKARYSAPGVTAKFHESLTWLWWIPEFLPKREKNPAAGFKPRWILHAGRHRSVPPGAKLHPSVRERMDALPDYRPPNLPE